AELLVCETHPSSDVLMVEGQGSLWHPAYAGVTLSLLHGSAPHVMVLCHQAGRNAIEEPPYTAIPPLPEVIARYEDMAATVRPARVACIALNCSRMSAAEAHAAVQETEEQTGLVTGDVFAGDSPRLWAALEQALPERRRPSLVSQ
ncbi:MAG: NAD-dependent epimerase/dehydratase family protein, partial [Actinomycetota bacterium]|nr:NAD-dependent epimerase/dehydratase family protein [Actinomycetota bacterium]